MTRTLILIATRTLILIAFVLATGCGDSGNPVGPSPVLALPRPGGPPTPVVVPPPPPIDVRPVHSRFIDRFWQQFVFDQYDDPGRWWGSYVLENSSPNVYIRMGDPTGRRVVSHQQRDHITRAVPRLARQLTGQPYRGRVESGIWDRTRQGWITVRFVTQEEEPDISAGACGSAWVGADPGEIWTHPASEGKQILRGPALLSRTLCPRVWTRDGVLPRGGPHRHHGQGRVEWAEHLQPARAVSRAPGLRGWPGPRVLRVAVPAKVCHAKAWVPNGRPGPPATDHRHRLKMVGSYTNPRHSLASPQMWWALRRFRKIAGGVTRKMRQQQEGQPPGPPRPTQRLYERLMADTVSAHIARTAAQPGAAQPHTPEPEPPMHDVIRGPADQPPRSPTRLLLALRQTGRETHRAPRTPGRTQDIPPPAHAPHSTRSGLYSYSPTLGRS